MRDIAELNRRTYSSALTVWDYQRSTELEKPEVAIIDRLRPEIEGKRILDIGVGGGRTTGHLLEISSDYIGIDYSRRMIAAIDERIVEAGLDDGGLGMTAIWEMSD